MRRRSILAAANTAARSAARYRYNSGMGRLMRAYSGNLGRLGRSGGSGSTGH